MRILRFARPTGQRGFGLLENDKVRSVVGSPWRGVRLGNYRAVLEDVRILAPVRPSKIIAVGLNYREHARELSMAIPDEPLIFLKRPSAVIGPNDTIVRPTECGRVDYEAELAVVIGATARGLAARDAGRYIFGYTCANDVTARDFQAKDGQWTRAKGFDTFCPLGPWIDTDFDPGDAAIDLRKNGDLRQTSRTSDMIFGVDDIVAFVSRIMTLVAGDVILTGTPSGVGSIDVGDVVEVSIGGIGTLKNRVEV